MAQIGSSWGGSTWAVPAWAAGTWADADSSTVDDAPDVVSIQVSTRGFDEIPEILDLDLTPSIRSLS